MRIRITLLLFILLVSGCSSIQYQAREEFTPEGYSDSRLEDGIYRVVYESYKRAGTKNSLKLLALRRAAELVTEENKSYFNVLSTDFEEYEDRIEFPEQIIKNIYRTPANPMTGGTGEMREFETIVPAHFKTFNIRKVTLTIEPLEEENKEAMAVADYIEITGIKDHQRTVF